MKDINWSEQHCGIHQGLFPDIQKNMADVAELILETFPDDVSDFIWDIKVHMLMPGQFPCIPNWHYDNVPRVNNEQDFRLIQPDKPMWLWVSNEPLTEFRKNGETWFLKPKTWTKFTQEDEHRGTRSEIFTWRGFIRATHKDIAPANRRGTNAIRRHTQVYLDASNFAW